MLDKPSLALKRRLKAPPSQVYSAWKDSKKIARWFGPRDTAQASVAAEIDLRVGGHYRISFTSEGGEQHRVGGVYRGVVPTGGWCSAGPGIRLPERASLVSITLTRDGETGTLLTLQHEQFFDVKARDGHERGWAGTLEKLDQYLC